MSLTLTGPISFETANNTLILNNQAECTVGFKFLIPSVGLASGVQQDLVMRFPGDGFYSYFIPDSNGTTVQFTTRWYIVGGSSSKTVTLNVGQAYWIVSTHTSGSTNALCYWCSQLDGGLTNPTVNFNTWFGIGYPTAGTTSQATIDELFFINGYCAVRARCSGFGLWFDNSRVNWSKWNSVRGMGFCRKCRNFSGDWQRCPQVLRWRAYHHDNFGRFRRQCSLFGSSYGLQ